MRTSILLLMVVENVDGLRFTQCANAAGLNEIPCAGDPSKVRPHFPPLHRENTQNHLQSVEICA